MSVYRRSHRQQRCQRWCPETGEWADCAFDEPETRVRKPTEDFEVQGPLSVPIKTLLSATGHQ
jgi:hypothetical protein